MTRMQDKVAVITGGNSGIGLETAKAFAREGAHVALFGRSAGTLSEAVEKVGHQAIGVRGDVTRVEDLERLYRTVIDELGRVDVLFVNAGMARFVPFEDTSEELFDQTIAVNLKGAYFTVQKALPFLNDNASVILNTSISNVQGIPNISVYAASKAALRSLARTLSAELLPRGIRVNAVSPGLVETPLWGRVGLSQNELEEASRELLSSVPIGRFAGAGEIADAVVYLASAESSYVIGTELVVDGGFSQL